jgi:hypothetical protein
MDDLLISKPVSPNVEQHVIQVAHIEDAPEGNEDLIHIAMTETPTPISTIGRNPPLEFLDHVSQEDEVNLAVQLAIGF